ncbi:hypothetical protein [Pseudomonas phage pPA-3099-2aT.2]|uniref:Uncharacterized protein n=1 Tax=Pseudomonas phage pPA-3099-2aT.2 TaxID=3003808 RepID=A0AAE9W681_9CAUD|nr:hypothetical protein QE325_gp090 [Pseudomonas phage pPA-3099-2aT.2]WBQ35181.1 hypothetical protein [Pseudomonas phage pPA-3099-2aT.2]
MIVNWCPIPDLNRIRRVTKPVHHHKCLKGRE